MEPRTVLADPPASPDAAPDATPDEVFGLWMSISTQHRLVLHRALARADVHPGQAMMLRVLAHHGECGQSQLAEALGVSRPNVTRILQRMERAGLVTRWTDETDQRHSRVELTAQGRAVVDRLESALTEHLTATLAQLSQTDRNDLARVLQTWTHLLEEATS